MYTKPVILIVILFLSFSFVSAQDSGEVQDMCGEDVSFCLDAIESGFEIWCDPRIRVGHEKTRVI